MAAFAVGATAVASIAFGFVPSLLARRLNLVETLTEDSLAPVGAGVRTGVARARALIMGGQVAVTAVLLVGAALVSQSFIGLMHADRGYQPDGLLTGRIALPDDAFTGPRRAQLVDAILARLRQAPGVTHAAVTSNLPLIHVESLMSFNLPSRDGRQGQVPVQTAVRDVSPDYFAALGIRVLEGRAFSETDTTTTEPVVVVNRSFANTYLQGHAIGADLPAGFSQRAGDWHVVGVVDDVHQQSPAEPAHPEVFVSYRQKTEGLATDVPALAVRTTRDPASLVPTLRAIVREENPGVALESVMTMDARLSGSLAKPRLYAVVLGGFAGFALLLSGVGLFGVLSYSVSLRAREIGVRAALGAQPADIVLLVVGQGLAVTGIGAAAGLATAFALGRYAASLLFGVTARDPFTFALVAVGILLIATVACLWPARRAAAIDPLTAMRR